MHKITQEFGLDPLNDYKKLFFVEKTSLPSDGLDVIQLLDYLLYIKNREADSGDINDIEELNTLIFNTCTS